ncbi:MAG: glycosyltransferase family 4 protein [Pseudomonadota bacterium]
MPEVYVTNFNPNFTGVSASAAAVTRALTNRYDLRLVGHSLPGCPEPITKAQAIAASRQTPEGKPFAIWHVRRNPEMQTGLWARDIRRLPIRLVFTSAAIRRHSAWPRWLISRMDAVIATSDAAATFVPNVRAVAPHGVDTVRFHPAPDRAAAWAATGHPGARGIATVGRIRPEKGTDRFVDTMITLLPRLPDVTALVIGKATRQHRDFAETLQAKVEAAGLTDRILFPGEIPADEMPALLRALSLVVNLPRYEGYGLAPLEAMASGTPFAATDTGAYRDFSAQGSAGVVVEPENASAQIEALLTGQHTAMAQRARDIAVQSYSVEREAAAIADVYEALCSEA